MKKNYKRNENKPHLSLIPKVAIWEMGKAFTHGITKHGKHRYKESYIATSDLLDSAIRHIYQFLDGEDYDKDSKCHHLGSAMSNIAMALWIYFNKPEQDDRWEKKQWKSK